MKLSTKATYGLRALIELARVYPNSLSLGEISKVEKISLKYLEAIFSRLKKAKLVESVKGAAGGYFLAKDPEKISAEDILEALGEGLPTAHCLGSQGKRFCTPKCQCGVGKLMLEIEKSVAAALNTFSLKDLI